MTAQEIERLLENQRKFYRSGATIPVAFRVEQLKNLRRAIQTFESEICEALLNDLGKSSYEAYMCEIGLALSEISHMTRNVKKCAAPRRVWTPLAQFPSRSYRQAVPRGSVLIMSPWNYPFLLTIGPLVDAIAAGNVATIKPSAYSPATSAVVAKLVAATFAPEYVAVVTGGREENAALLDQKFDFIFFTGGQTVVHIFFGTVMVGA